MNLFDVVVLAIVEGITEFLPISSTAHLVLTANILSIPQTDFVKSFEIFIQLGAICSIVLLYGRLLLKNVEIWKRILVAFLPTAVVGFTLYPFIKDYLIGNTFISLVALFLGGVVLILLEMLHKEKGSHSDSVESLSYKQSLGIGIFQSLSIVPGVSRAAATIMGGLFLGAKRKAAVEFSFLLAVPTMLAATALDLKESSLTFSQQEWIQLGVGFIVSLLVAILAVKFLLRFVQHHSFIPFGIYRILLVIIYWLILL